MGHLPQRNAYVTPLLTDYYEIMMAYSYFKCGRSDDRAVFEVFFRSNPFRGEYTIFAGLEEVLKYVQSFKLSKEDIAYVRTIVPSHIEDAFFEYLSEIDCSRVRIRAMLEGSICFPREPLMIIEGPLGVCQLLESTVLNLLNFPSLMATNACRFRMAAGPDKILVEAGLRQAQGPDGAVSASRYAYIGGFDFTSNITAANLYDIPLNGSFSHAFVSSFSGIEDLTAESTTIEGTDILPIALRYRNQLNKDSNIGELAAFVCYAVSFPQNFVALVDTYDTLRSGIPNFLAVALTLEQVGKRAVGIRLDSGDIAYLSRCARQMFAKTASAFNKPELATALKICASNNINEDVINSLNEQGHEVDIFLVGTHLVTCQKQPSLGMVYKLTELNNKPRMKLSQDIGKLTIPGNKEVYRLIGKDDVPLLDMIIRKGETAPLANRRILAQHPFDGKKRVFVTPKIAIPLLTLVWSGSRDDGESVDGIRIKMPSLEKLRAFRDAQVSIMREDHLRSLNATPYKVSVSTSLYTFLHDLWNRVVPIPELS